MEAPGAPMPTVPPAAQPTLCPHQMPRSPLNPAGLTTAGLSHPVLSAGYPLPCPFYQRPLPPPLTVAPGAQQLWLSPLCVGGGQHPHLQPALNAVCNLCVCICCLPMWKVFEGGDGVLPAVPDTHLQAWPHRAPAEPLLQTEQMGDGWLGGRRNGKIGEGRGMCVWVSG